VTLTPDPGRVVRFLGTGTVVLLVLGFVTQMARQLTGRHLFGLARTLNLDGEANVPTFFAALLLVIAAACLAVRALHEHQLGGHEVRHWAILSGGFVYLGFDEAARLHELFGRPARFLLGNLDTGPVHAWVLFGLVILIVVVAGFFPFLQRIPRRTARLLVLAGALYVGGAIFMEMATSAYAHRARAEDAVAPMLMAAEIGLTVVEEGMEMSGVLLLIYAVLDDLRRRGADLQIRFAAPSPPA